MYDLSSIGQEKSRNGFNFPSLIYQGCLDVCVQTQFHTSSQNPAYDPCRCAPASTEIARRLACCCVPKHRTAEVSVAFRYGPSCRLQHPLRYWPGSLPYRGLGAKGRRRRSTTIDRVVNRPRGLPQRCRHLQPSKAHLASSSQYRLPLLTTGRVVWVEI
jgi:hypothetical protein